MRRVLNRLLRSKGYEIQKIGRAIFLLEKLLEKQDHLSFIQVGANDGVNFDNIYPFFIDHKCDGLVIEPLPQFYERLCLNYKAYPRIVPLKVAVHPTAASCSIYSVDDRKLQDYKHSDAGIASFDRNHLIKLGIAESAIIQTEVPCRNLMSLVDEYKLHELDYLQIDTEGFDDEIVGMIDFARLKPKIIKFETDHLGREKKAAVFRRLQAHGYSLIDEKHNAIALLEV